MIFLLITIVLIILFVISKIITKRTKELKYTSEQFRLLFDNAGSGIAIHQMIFDNNGNPKDYIFLDANNAFERYTGLLKKNIINKRVTEIIPGIEDSGIIEKYGTVIKTGEQLIFEQYIEPLKRYYSINVYRVKYDQFVTSFTDTTEQKNIERELEEHKNNLEELVKERTRQLEETSNALLLSEKQASLGRMVAGIAHEINTPIGVALTASTFLYNRASTTKELYEDGKLTENKFIESLNESVKSSDIISNNIVRAAKLIKSLKEMSVDQSSGQERMINFPKYTDMIMTTLEPKFRGTNYTYDFDIQDYDGFLDPGYYVQYITNLLINSIDHGFEGRDYGHITMSIKFDKDGFIHHIYEDDGKGISEDKLDKIFEPFYTTRRGDGFTGLGCNIIYNIATDFLGGTIKVENRKDGGVRFTLIYKPKYKYKIN